MRGFNNNTNPIFGIGSKAEGDKISLLEKEQQRNWAKHNTYYNKWQPPPNKVRKIPAWKTTHHVIEWHGNNGFTDCSEVRRVKNLQEGVGFCWCFTHNDNFRLGTSFTAAFTLHVSLFVCTEKKPPLWPNKSDFRDDHNQITISGFWRYY